MRWSKAKNRSGDIQQYAVPDEAKEEMLDAEILRDTQNPTGEGKIPESLSDTETESTLTRNGITTQEGALRQDQEETLNTLSLTAEEASTQDEISITLSNVWTIAGLSFNQPLSV